MELNTAIVKEKVQQYLTNEVGKNEISEWAHNVMGAMLKGEVFETGKIVNWEFITLLTQANDCCGSCIDDEIRTVERVLSGKENSRYTFCMKIPEKFQRPSTLNIRNLLTKRAGNGRLTTSEIAEIEVFSNHRSFSGAKTVTVIDLLEMQIACLLSSFYKFHVQDSEMVFDLKHTIFLSESEESEDACLSKLLRLLGYCTGEEFLSICIVYNQGEPQILLS